MLKCVLFDKGMVSDLCKGLVLVSFMSLMISSYINKFLRTPCCMHDCKKGSMRPSWTVHVPRPKAAVCEPTELEVSILMCPTSVLHSLSPLVVIHDTKVMVPC